MFIILKMFTLSSDLWFLHFSLLLPIYERIVECQDGLVFYLAKLTLSI